MKTILLALLALVLALPAAAQQPPPDSKAAEEAKRQREQRERAVERCNANRGTDCTTDAGLREWLGQDRSRSEAEAEGAQSINQAPKATPRPAK